MPDCIEHMDDDIGAIQNANRVLKKGYKMYIVSVINDLRHLINRNRFSG